MVHIPLNDVCKINMGQSPDSSSYNEVGDGIPFFQGNADFGERYPVTRVWCNAPTKIANAGDILISVRAPIGALNYAKEKCCIGRGLAAITPDESRVSSPFVFWFLRGKSAELNSKGTGSTFKAIGRRILEETMIPQMDLRQQRLCADNLERVYTIVQMRKQQLRLLDNLIKARFVEMFGDNSPSVKLGDICQMINGDRGKNYPSGNDFVAEGVPFVNAGHLQNRQVDFSGMNYITEEKFNLLSQGKMQRDDILYCLRGSLGKHGLVSFERGAVASSLVILRCDKRKVLPTFLLYAIETPDIERQLKAANNGSSQPNLSAASVKAYDIKLPSMREQREFVSFVEQVDKSKFAVQKSLKETQKLFDSLMQQYFG